jgi:type 1 fimbria pilin
MQIGCLAVSCLACALIAGAPSARAESGRIDFAGSIVEQGCPVRGATLDCPPGRRANAIVRPLDVASAQRQIRASLLAYALQRDRSAAWQVVEVTYR